MSRLLVRCTYVFAMVVTLAMSAMPTLARAGEYAVTSDNRFCYTWDVQNNTDQDANDLHVELTDVQSVGDIYLGPMNPFGLPSVASSKSPVGPQTLSLDFTGATVVPAEVVRIGFCTATTTLRLANGEPSFRWTMDGISLQPNPLFIGLKWEWRDRRTLQVTLFNDQPVSVLLTTLNLLDPSQSLALDDLGPDVTSQLPMLAQFVEDPILIAPGAEVSFGIFFDFGPSVSAVSTSTLAGPQHTQGSPPGGDQPFDLEIAITAEDDPGNTTIASMQGLAFPARHLPLVVK